MRYLALLLFSLIFSTAIADEQQDTITDLTFTPYGFSKEVDGKTVYYHVLEFTNQGHYAYVLEFKMADAPDRIWAPWFGDWSDPDYSGRAYKWQAVEEEHLWGGLAVTESRVTRIWDDVLIRVRIIDTREDYITYMRWAFSLIRETD